MNDVGHVGLVNAHAEGVGGHHDGFPVVEEILLVIPALLIGQTCVVPGGGNAVQLQILADLLHGLLDHPAGYRVDGRRAHRLVKTRLGYPAHALSAVDDNANSLCFPHLGIDQGVTGDIRVIAAVLPDGAAHTVRGLEWEGNLKLTDSEQYDGAVELRTVDEDQLIMTLRLVRTTSSLKGWTRLGIVASRQMQAKLAPDVEIRDKNYRLSKALYLLN